MISKFELRLKWKDFTKGGKLRNATVQFGTEEQERLPQEFGQSTGVQRTGPGYLSLGVYTSWQNMATTAMPPILPGFKTRGPLQVVICSAKAPKLVAVFDVLRVRFHDYIWIYAKTVILAPYYSSIPIHELVCDVIFILCTAPQVVAVYF